MDMLTNIVHLGLVGATVAVALWAWHEIRAVAMRNDVHAHRPGRDV